MKNKKLMIVIIILIALGVAGVAVGATAAYWTEASALTGIAPGAFTFDFTVWTKYVTWEFNADNEKWTYDSGVYVWTGDGSPANFTIAITGFKDYLGEEVVFPKSLGITYKVGASGTNTSATVTVTKIRNTVFSDVTLKAMPTAIVVPAGVIVESAAFSGLTNLKEVYFGGSYPVSQTTVNAYAFSGCNSLSRIVFESGKNGAGNTVNADVRFYESAFAGCSGITEVKAPSGASISYGSGTDGKTNFSGFKTYVGINNSDLSITTA